MKSQGQKKSVLEGYTWLAYTHTKRRLSAPVSGCVLLMSLLLSARMQHWSFRSSFQKPFWIWIKNELRVQKKKRLRKKARARQRAGESWESGRKINCRSRVNYEMNGRTQTGGANKKKGACMRKKRLRVYNNLLQKYMNTLAGGKKTSIIMKSGCQIRPAWSRLWPFWLITRSLSWAVFIQQVYSTMVKW